MTMTLSRSEITKRHQEKCDAIMLRPSLEDGKRYREAAKELGLPTQQFFFKAAEEYIKNHLSAPEDTEIK